MLETQRKWYLPAPRVLGWHIGAWNLIGVSCQSLISTCADFSCQRESASHFAVLWASQVQIVGAYTKEVWRLFGDPGAF